MLASRFIGKVIGGNEQNPLTSGSSGKMLSTSLLYRGLRAPQHPQTPNDRHKHMGVNKMDIHSRDI